MTQAADRVGLPLPPPFYGLVLPAQPAFVSPPLPDIWQCVEATWRRPLKTKAAIASMSGIVRVQGRSTRAQLAAHLLPRSAGWAEGKKPLPPLPRDREALEYLDKMFRLGSQMAAAANNLGVLGVSLITP